MEGRWKEFDFTVNIILLTYFTLLKWLNFLNPSPVLNWAEINCADIPFRPMKKPTYSMETVHSDH